MFAPKFVFSLYIYLSVFDEYGNKEIKISRMICKGNNAYVGLFVAQYLVIDVTDYSETPELNLL